MIILEPTYGVVVDLTSQHRTAFKDYKTEVEKRIKKAFPSLPSDFEAELAGIEVFVSCGTEWTFYIYLPDGKYAKISFTPNDPPSAGFYKVDPEPKTSLE